MQKWFFKGSYSCPWTWWELKAKPLRCQRRPVTITRQFTSASVRAACLRVTGFVLFHALFRQTQRGWIITCPRATTALGLNPLVLKAHVLRKVFKTETRVQQPCTLTTRKARDWAAFSCSLCLPWSAGLSLRKCTSCPEIKSCRSNIRC